jgi:molybdopterin-guanine dinucleotide biosynthesis protein B
MILGIYGRSKSGKTSLIESLAGSLTEDGFSVATVKHIKQEGFTIDTEDKDTWRHSKAGAGLVVASSDKETSFIVKRAMDIEKITDLIEKNFDFNIILVEGFKGSSMPKVAVGDIDKVENTVFRYTDNEEEIVDYLRSKLEFERVYNSLPLLDCEDCGMTCATFADMVCSGKSTREDCKHYGKKNICLTVDGKSIPLKKFPAEIFGNAVTAMLKSLRGVDEFANATIELRGPGGE